MVRSVGTDACELRKYWRLLGLGDHQPSGAKGQPQVTLRIQVVCHVKYIVLLYDMTISKHMMRTKLMLKRCARLVMIEEPAADIDIFKPEDVFETATRTVKSRRRSNCSTKRPVYYTKTTCEGSHQETSQSENEQKLDDPAMHAALLTAAICGDDLAHLACIRGIQNVDD